MTFLISNSPQNDRFKYRTQTDAVNRGFEPAAGAVVSEKPCILTALYISIRETLVGTIFIQFYDSATIVAANNDSSYDTCSEPLTVPGGTFVWEPQGATSAQYQYTETRRAVKYRKDCQSLYHISEIRGLTFDNGLFVVASTAKTGLALAAANLIRIVAWIRSPSDMGTAGP